MRLGALGLVLVFMGSLWGEYDLWVSDSNLVKMGKKEAYEKYKKERIKSFGRGSEFGFYAYEGLEELQYTYLTQVGEFGALEKLLGQWDAQNGKLPPQAFLPYTSTINSSIRTLQNYMEPCSHVTQGKQLVDFPLAYFYELTVEPVNGPDFEARLNSLAQSTDAYFMTWKILFGQELPRYCVGVFGSSEKEIERLEILTPELKGVLNQNVQKVKLRKDLSLLKKS